MKRTQTNPTYCSLSFACTNIIICNVSNTRRLTQVQDKCKALHRPITWQEVWTHPVVKTLNCSTQHHLLKLPLSIHTFSAPSPWHCVAVSLMMLCMWNHVAGDFENDLSFPSQGNTPKTLQAVISNGGVFPVFGFYSECRCTTF